jgi:hypothetical protein
MHVLVDAGPKAATTLLHRALDPSRPQTYPSSADAGSSLRDHTARFVDNDEP